jgi:hypothetical protein
MLRWFKATNVAGAVIGGVAVSIQAHARYTRDLDALVVVHYSKWRKFVERAAAFGFAGRVPDVVEFAGQSRMVLLLHESSGIPLDVSLGALEFEEELIGRATIVKLGRLKVPVAAPDDLIILKAVAQRPIDLADIDALLEAHPRLDLARIRRTVAKFAAILESPEIVTQTEVLLQRRRKPGRKG